MRAAIYARYSKGPNQTDQSIEGQVRVCTEYCQKNNLEVKEVYADRHITGKTDARPEFQRLIADCKAGKFDAIVVYKTDRLSRDKYDAVIYKREIKKAGVKIFYAAETIPEGPEGIILESLMEGLAEYYSAELAQKIKRGMHESALKGKAMGNSVPLGYKVNDEGYYEIDPEGAKVVEQIFKMYIDGTPNAEICRYLNGLGYKTSRGNEFNKNSINRIIKNEKYIGLYKAADVVIENGMPAIIDHATFAMAQAEMLKKRTSKVVRTTTGDYLLSGKLFCGKCGSKFTGVSGTSRSGSTHYYYYCANARKKKCDKEHVQKDYIESLVVDLTVDYILQAEVLESLSWRLWELQNESDDRDEQIAYLKKKLAENKRATDNLVKAVEQGLGTTALLTRLEALEQEKSNIDGEIAYQKTKAFGMSQEQLLYFLVQFIKNEGEDQEVYKRRIIKAFVSKVYLYDDKIQIFYNISENENGRTTELSIEGSECSTCDQISGLDESLVEHIRLYLFPTTFALEYII